MMKSVYLFCGVLLLAGVGAYVWWGRSAAPATTAVQGRPMVEVMVPQLQGQEKTGEAAYNSKCAQCHGANAAGQLGIAPPLVHKIYEPSHHGDMAFVLAARNGVRSHHWKFGDMPPVDGITDDEVAVILSYVRTLQRANGIN